MTAVMRVAACQPRLAVPFKASAALKANAEMAKNVRTARRGEAVHRKPIGAKVAEGMSAPRARIIVGLAAAPEPISYNQYDSVCFRRHGTRSLPPETYPQT